MNIVTELADRGDLFDKIIKKPYTEEKAAQIFYQICKGVKYLHENKIMHRDIKAENITIMTNPSSNKEEIKIIDLKRRQ